MKVAVPLAKSILAPLGVIAAALAIDAEIQKEYMTMVNKQPS